MSEHDEQATFFEWVDLNRVYARDPNIRKALKLCYAVPNGAKLEKIKNKKGDWWSPQANKLKKEGLEPGMPDINLDWPVISGRLGIKEPPHDIKAGLRIEMKYGKNKLSDFQKDKKYLLEQAGFKYEVCYSAQEAIRAVIHYLPFAEKDYQGSNNF
jgi:hypothetical protein